ncbi:MAG: tRNA preQ1(34) S-adenosylmethionine ribosyltransferase-isomerase QueA [Thermoflavifilum sp.]|nr:tRNA preQ1(34) S-adenosylmethionine ribosyltransferase-isomerase QueA [Thermoflavifilum sp.]MCL6512834.1 tRNA preQ1(34) S-adenosylmethionine ribosyltransferase-isomerase QueA [Alicyclobacillus sp.]
MRVDLFDYELPEELIAQTPLEDRADSRLMVVDPVNERIEHARFRDIGRFLRPGDVLVLNNSKVLRARLYGTKADTGARVECLLVRPVHDAENEWLALARPAKRLRPGTVIQFDDGRVTAEVTATADEGMRVLRFHLDEPMEAFLERAGEVPLPPYIREPLKDQDRYQTVYAQQPGSIAAPTAGLHFTEQLLDEVRAMGVQVHFVTLHVGIGTFRPVKVERVEEHHMHSEWYEVSPQTASAVNQAKAEGRRVIAVGTTALRTLEAAGASGELRSGSGETDLFVYPGYRFRIVDALITNFHLPKSTLMMLVAALMGIDFTKRAYETAVRERYRFFSFGDAMFITRRAEVAVP